MTFFGVDEASFQGSLDLTSVRKQGFTFVAIKCTEGAHYVSPTFKVQLASAKANQFFTAVYHFLHPGNIAAQVDNLLRNMVDQSLPIMLDCERSSDRPTLGDAVAFKQLAESKGLKVTLIYLPLWYWREIGVPSLAGWNVVSSSYPKNTHSYASVLYRDSGGDYGPGWKAYGNQQPVIWQFGSAGKITGYNGNVDVDAFKGSLTELEKYFKNYGAKVVKPKVLGPNLSDSLKGLYAAKRYALGHKMLNRATRIQKIIDSVKAMAV